MNLQELQAAAATCTGCSLHSGRIKPVFAKGNSNAKLMICGMVPADDENRVGIPFVGRAGKLLDQILKDVDLTLDDIYITNLVKCYLKAGLPLQQDWIDNCLAYLINQIDMIKPRAILTLGKDASVTLLGMTGGTSLGSIRGKGFAYSKKIQVIPTYHPSYLLRNGGKNSRSYPSVMNDFIMAKNISIIPY